MGYLPYLTVLLPAKISGLAGTERIAWLAAATLAGAIAASLGNIVFGWASDLVGTRRGWARVGLVLTMASYVPLHFATTDRAIVVAVIFYQLTLNMLLSPLVAWAADAVPDRRKGVLGGMIAAGAPIGALAAVVVTLPVLPRGSAQLMTVCALMLVLAAPLLLSPTPAYPDRPSEALAAAAPKTAPRNFVFLWLARLLVQLAGNLLFGFLYFYFEGFAEAPSQAGIARLAALPLLLGFPITLCLGRMSDRAGTRKPFVAAAAILAALGLFLMAPQVGLVQSSLGYCLFGCASAVFLSLQSSLSMQLLPSPSRRARDLGLLNLTNTLPALVAPLLTIWLVPDGRFGAVLTILAGLMILAALFVLLVRDKRQPLASAPAGVQRSL